MVFISLGCSKVPGTVGTMVLQNKETAKEKKILQIQCFPKVLLDLDFLSILLGEKLLFCSKSSTIIYLNMA